MQRTAAIFLSLTLVFSFSLKTFAQKDAAQDISVVLPAQSIEKFVRRLLPLRIDMGKYFSGSLWIKSIKGFRIEKNKIAFSSHLYGENIVYAAKIGNQISTIELGSIDLFSDWESAFRFDADKKTLYVRPHFKERVGTNKGNRNVTVINSLFRVLSDIEYPISLQEIKPVTADFLGNSLTINFDVTNITAADNKLTVTLMPVPQKRGKSRAAAEKNS